MSNVTFTSIDLSRHADLCVCFRRDAYHCSFPNGAERFNQENGRDSEKYLAWLQKQTAEFPEGCVHVLENGRIVGQIEMSLRSRLGYVNLFYLIPEARWIGIGDELHRYAIAKFKQLGISNHEFARSPNRVAGLRIERPNQVWVGDITDIRLGEGFVYLAVLMDVFTRCIRGWHLGRGLDHRLTLTALHQALSEHQPEIHHSDQGVEYAATGYVEVLKARGVQISIAEVGEPTQNGYAERLMRTIKEEEVDLSEYRNFTEAYTQIKTFLEDVYMKKRIHSSIGYLTPIEFETEWKDNQ
jgi:GNAT superfamily N-acetyltransferase